MCKENYSWNPTKCVCTIDNSAIMCDEIINVEVIVSTTVTIMCQQIFVTKA